jgi:HEAT repeat protein
MGAYMIFSQINKRSDCDDTKTDYITVLINQLRAVNGTNRMQAREELICLGNAAVPALLSALSSDDPQQRWQVIKVLEDIYDTRAIPALVECLKDESASVRWTASNALLKYKRAAVRPLLESLTRDSDSVWLRRSAQHILHVMKDRGELSPEEEKVFEALQDVVPTASVPWAAEKALESLLYKNK